MNLDILFSGLAVGCIYSLIAMSFSLIFRSSGVLNIAQGETVMVGGLVGYTFVTLMGLNFYIGIVLTMLVTALIGYLSNALVFEPIQKRGGEEVHVLIASVGILIILPQLSAIFWGAEPLSYSSTLSQSRMAMGDVSISGLSFLIIILSILIMVAFQLFFRFTRLGQAMRAIADDRVMSQLLGISIVRYVGLIFLVSGALAGAAGVMMGPIYYVSYDMGIIGIKAFAAAVIGGFGNITGAMIGGILLGLIEAYGGTMISSAYRDIILYGLLIFVLLVKPTGLLGVKQRRDTV